MTEAVTTQEEMRIECRICGAKVHSIQLHLKEMHPEFTTDSYQARYPGSPLLSKVAEQKLAEAAARKGAAPLNMAGAAALSVVAGKEGPMRKPMNELFGLGNAPAAMNAQGKPIPITVINVTGADRDLIPEVDNNHVYDIELLKNICMGIELGIPVYLYGHAGTGKTTTLLQVAARTGRPALRVQHTINTEEAHVVGQWVVKAGETQFQYGPLALAMMNGWLYIADEYDFALPSVLSVYQPVLEGNALVIKDAPPEKRIIKPHPNFRFAATGNTNGAGDDTGLYQGTNIQNAANYERFGIVARVAYMKPELEALAITNQAQISKKDAEKLVDFATRVREAFDSGSISSTVSPRALIHAAKLGLRRSNYNVGLQLAFINRLGKVDREAVQGIAQRIFGSSGF